VIQNTQAKFILSGVTGRATVTVERSSVLVILEQKNTMMKMLCLDSNITFISMEDAWLSLDSSSESQAGPAIGTPAGERCSSLVFRNASISAKAGADTGAIGSGKGAIVGVVLVLGGNVAGTSAGSKNGGGAGIGTGSGESAGIATLAILGGNVTAACTAGTGLSGSALGPAARASITNVTIVDANLIAPSTAGSGNSGSGVGAGEEARIASFAIARSNVSGICGGFYVTGSGALHSGGLEINTVVWSKEAQETNAVDISEGGIATNSLRPSSFLAATCDLNGFPIGASPVLQDTASSTPLPSRSDDVG
jgi:hypothetical protein